MKKKILINENQLISLVNELLLEQRVSQTKTTPVYDTHVTGKGLQQVVGDWRKDVSKESPNTQLNSVKIYNDMMKRHSNSTQNPFLPFTTARETTGVAPRMVSLPPMSEQTDTLKSIMDDTRASLGTTTGILVTSALSTIFAPFGGTFVVEGIYATLLVYDLTSTSFSAYNVLFDLLGILTGGAILKTVGPALKSAAQISGNNLVKLFNVLAKEFPQLINIIKGGLNLIAKFLQWAINGINILIQKWPGIKSILSLLLKGANKATEIIKKYIAEMIQGSSGEVAGKFAQKVGDKYVKDKAKEYVVKPVLASAGIQKPK